MKPKEDPLQSRYLDLCEQLQQQVALMRNYAMNESDIWLAQAELEKINQTLGELNALLTEIKSSQPR